MSSARVTTFVEVSELIDVVVSFFALQEGGDPLTFPMCWQALGTMRLVNSQWHAEATPRMWSTLDAFVASVPLQSARLGTWLSRERRRFKRCLEASALPGHLTFGSVPGISPTDAARELLISEEDDGRVAVSARAMETAKPMRSSLVGGASVCFVDYLLLSSAHVFCRMDHQDFLDSGIGHDNNRFVDFGTVVFSLAPTEEGDDKLPFRQWKSSKISSTTYVEDDARDFLVETTRAYDRETGLIVVEKMLDEFVTYSMVCRDKDKTPTFDTKMIDVSQAVDYLLEFYVV